jgi:hypothetical protein
MVPGGDSNQALKSPFYLGWCSVRFSIYSQIYSLFFLCLPKHEFWGSKKKVPPVVRRQAKHGLFTLPLPGCERSGLDGFSVPVLCWAAASACEASRATRNRKRAAHESLVHSPAAGSELPSVGHPLGRTQRVGVCRATW